MNLTDQPSADRRQMILLAPLIVAGNVFVLLCMAGLCIGALRGSDGPVTSPPGADVNQRIVSDYLAQRVPSDRYRIRQWFPATPLRGNLTAAAGNPSEHGKEKLFAQRVRLVFYGPSGARQLDTVYWIQNGEVVRRTDANHSRFAQES
jgi:hypothetical protein